jgi:hypothetical protein
MAISAGDIVLNFFGETSQLDQAFNRVATEAGEKMGLATKSIQGTTDAVDGMGKSMAVGQQGAVELGEVVNLAGEKSRESMYEARGEAGLLGEAFGIHLPRHVRSFVAELPGVGTALSAAFQATAVLFLISALVEGIQKIVEWAEHGEKMRQAWEKAALELENLTIKQGDHTKSLELANLKLDDQFAKLEGRPDRNKLAEALLETSIAADNLAAAFAKDFEKMTEEINSATSITGRFSQSLIEIAHSWGLMAVALFSPSAAMGAMSAGMTEVKNATSQVNEKLLEMNKLRLELFNAKTEEEQISAQHKLAEGYDVLAQTTEHALTITEKYAPNDIKLITELSNKVVEATAAKKDAGLQAEDISKKVTLAEREQWEAFAEFGDKAFKKRAEEWKQATDQEEKARTEARDKAIAALQEEEKEKLAATKQGSQARIDVIDAAIKEEQGKGLQDTAFYKSLLTQRVQAVTAAADAEQQAINRASATALKQAEDNAKVETAAVTEKYSEQEKAVEKLLQIRYISETQAAHQLEMLYEGQKQKLLKILNDLLKQEQDAVKNAQSKATAAKENPFISPQQVAEAEKLLVEAQHAVADTQVKISNTTKQFQDKELALAKGFYGKALALAIASGNQLLAEKLKENHAALLSAQAQLAEAKARGANTAAIDKQIQELKKLEKELGKEAKSLQASKGAIDQFRDSMKAAYAEEAQAFATAAEAMITGQQSFGQAMEAATFKMLGSMAQQWGAYFIAKGTGNLAEMNYTAAAGDFAAAALFEILGGVLSGLGSNVGNSGGGGGGDHPNVDTNNPNNQPGQNPAPGGRNVPHLQAGGLMTTDSLAMIHRNEVAIPLDNPGVMDAIGAAIARHSEGGAGGMNFYVKGLVSPDSLSKVMKRMSRQAQTGRARLLATNSHKLTRRA